MMTINLFIHPTLPRKAFLQRIVISRGYIYKYSCGHPNICEPLAIDRTAPYRPADPRTHRHFCRFLLITIHRTRNLPRAYINEKDKENTEGKRARRGPPCPRSTSSPSSIPRPRKSPEYAAYPKTKRKTKKKKKRKDDAHKDRPLTRE